MIKEEVCGVVFIKEVSLVMLVGNNKVEKWNWDLFRLWGEIC